MKVLTHHNRRSFLKVSAAAGGGLLLGFNFLLSCQKESDTEEPALDLPPPEAWYDVNGYLRIADNGQVTIISPNPEIGQNVKTSMPMIVAEELEVDWNYVIVEQGKLDTDAFTRQVAGGSQSIRKSWEALRMAGATAKTMLVAAAAQQWEVAAADCQVEKGVVTGPDGQTAHYGALAGLAAEMEVPETVALKDPKDFTIIGQSKTNVDLDNILRGEPLFGLDYRAEGMLYASVLRPPAFGKKLASFNDNDARKVPGVVDVVRFEDKIAVLATSTWPAMKAKKTLIAKWYTELADELEDSTQHQEALLTACDKKTTEPRRTDGDIDQGLAESDFVLDRSYEAPFLPHNCLEPMNFFADVTDEKVLLVGPIQTPQWQLNRVSEQLGRPKEEIEIHMTRMGGGFGRRLYGDFVTEAAAISDLVRKPVKVVYSREDDMLAGVYRPASRYRIKAGIKDGKLHAYHLTEACFNGEMFDPMPSNFPAGVAPHYRVDSHKLESNITTGAWRAPYANFLAYAEQAFFDELAVMLEKDPIDLRLELLEQARANPVGEEHNYEIDKMIGVTKLVREKSNWRQSPAGTYQGFALYYSHNTYVAEVAEVALVDELPVVKKVVCAVDCGIVVNPVGALNQVEGGIIDGIGHAMYGDFAFTEGRSTQENFHQYRLIRMPEAPQVETHFVESLNSPTGLGEPTLPPAGGAVANAIAKAKGQRLYQQPFAPQFNLLG